ncbi:MAG: IS66 family transposase [Actinomycetia bacterium]|nr:IS66 family transposase [Actinomycetes bacterium]
MKARLLSGGVVMADETVLQVLREDMRPAKAKSCMWLYRTGPDARHPLVLYEYRPSRSHECPKEFLAGFKGHLQAYEHLKYLFEQLPDMTTSGIDVSLGGTNQRFPSGLTLSGHLPAAG